MWCQVRSGILAAFGGLLIGKGIYAYQLIIGILGGLIVVYALYRLKVVSCALPKHRTLRDTSLIPPRPRKYDAVK
jgi:hypothetical protein